MTARLEVIPIHRLKVSKGNVRKLQIEADKLVDSILNEGLRKPLDVMKSGDHYEIIDGQRRFLACRKIVEEKLAPEEKLVNFTSLPCLIHEDVINEDESREFSLSDALHKKDISDLDKAKAIRAEIIRLGGLESVSQKYGIPKTTLSQYDKLNELAPEVQKLIESNSTCGTSLPLRKAIEVARFPREKQFEIAQKILPLKKDHEIRTVLAQAKGNSTNCSRPVLLTLPSEMYSRLVEVADDRQSRVESVILEAVHSFLEATH